MLLVGIYGPEFPCHEVLVKHEGNLKYSVSYQLKEVGDYTLVVKWGEDHVPGSPFHVSVAWWSQKPAVIPSDRLAAVILSISSWICWHIPVCLNLDQLVGSSSLLTCGLLVDPHPELSSGNQLVKEVDGRKIANQLIFAALMFHFCTLL